MQHFLKLCVCVGGSVVSNSLWVHGLYPSSSYVHGILQTRILEWVAICFSGDLPDPGIESGSPALQADSLPSEPQRKAFLKNWKAYYSFLECYLFFSYERHLEQNSKVVWNRIMPLSPLPIVHSPLNLKYFEYLPQGGIDESFGNSIFNFWRNYHTIFHCGWTILHSQEQCIWVPILLHTHQHLLFVFIIVI